VNTCKDRLLLSYVFYGFVLIAVALFAINKIHESNIKEYYLESEMKVFAEKKSLLENYAQSTHNRIFAIRDSKIFQNYLENADETNVIALFKYVTDISKDIMQLRYIDENGLEKIRVDRLNYGGKPVFVSKEALQNKAHRYYFQEIIDFNAMEQSWYSNIDLNIEHNRIERPLKPVLRVGMPVFVKGQCKGIVVVNIFMDNILKKLSNTSLYKIYLVDKEGNFIIHPNKKYSWGKYLHTNYGLKEEFAKESQNILNQDEYKGEKLYSKVINLNNGEKIKMIFETKYFKVQERIREQTLTIIFVMFVMFLTSLPIAYMFSVKFGSLKAKADQLNDSLEKTVREKTAKLQKLNDTLEQRVEEEIEKNREKDKQLLYQSRLANIGEMINMIAHQWRQPLASISSTVATLKIDIMMNSYKKEIFEESLSRISKYSQYLSSTIDDFRGFFKDNKESKSTTLGEVCEGALSIIEAALSYDNIRVVKQYECKEKFTSYHNELKQMVLNLIKNSEDALVERHIENPTIHIKTYKNEHNGMYVLELSDNAGGIPEEIIGDIFMPYFSTKKSKDGTGLGLYMSKIIVENNCKGTISAKNKIDGVCFTIELESLKNNA